ncbi:MAG: hypothetical protein B6244_11410 [Candidatus Cloacimonetes bacterium 4572_55]|nr:MAG: hypothetical protein B6244_11410 [Candidatus Cloacimonetes bacterium 4572_55]
MKSPLITQIIKNLTLNQRESSQSADRIQKSAEWSADCEDSRGYEKSIGYQFFFICTEKPRREL